MTGQPGRSGGARTGAGRPPGTGGTPGTGRPKGAHDITLSPARLVSPGQKWKYAERALQYADEMLDILVAIARDGETDAAHCERITRSPRRQSPASSAGRPDSSIGPV